MNDDMEMFLTLRRKRFRFVFGAPGILRFRAGIRERVNLDRRKPVDRIDDMDAFRNSGKLHLRLRERVSRHRLRYLVNRLKRYDLTELGKRHVRAKL